MLREAEKPTAPSRVITHVTSHQEISFRLFDEMTATDTTRCSHIWLRALGARLQDFAQYQKLNTYAVYTRGTFTVVKYLPHYIGNLGKSINTFTRAHFTVVK